MELTLRIDTKRLFGLALAGGLVAAVLFRPSMDSFSPFMREWLKTKIQRQDKGLFARITSTVAATGLQAVSDVKYHNFLFASIVLCSWDTNTKLLFLGIYKHWFYLGATTKD
jgi:hypothetical protein